VEDRGWSQGPTGGARVAKHLATARAFGDAHSGDRYTKIRYEIWSHKPEKVMRPTSTTHISPSVGLRHGHLLPA
jgi:hypothetical protein